MRCKSPACLIGFGLAKSTTPQLKNQNAIVRKLFTMIMFGFIMDFFFCVQESYSELVTTSLIALMVIMCTYKISFFFYISTCNISLYILHANLSSNYAHPMYLSGIF